jgi:hypothetical protein
MRRRRLSPLEISQARLVFGNNLNYEKVFVIEEIAWPYWVGRLGAFISRTKPPTHNAVTLGNRVYFSRTLCTTSQDPNQKFLSDMSWLIHELTHAWQYQLIGLRYLPQTLWVQIKYGRNCYDYGWEQGLTDALDQGKGLSNFNLEQQGEIARHYYLRSKQDLDTKAWNPIARGFQST